MTEIDDVRRQMDSANQDAYDIGYGDGKSVGYVQGFGTAAFTAIATAIGYAVYIDFDKVMGMLK